MSEKKICDFCLKDITSGPRFSVMVFDDKREADVLDQDACRSCERRILRALKFLVKQS